MPKINNYALAGGYTDAIALTAAATGSQGGWENTTGRTCLVEAVIDVTTAATGAATLDVGVAAAASTSNDKLMDGIDVNAATGEFSSGTGTNGRRVRKVPAGHFVTVHRASGDPTGMVADLYVHVTELD